MADYWETDGTPLEDWELETRYDSWLDDVYGEVSIAGYEYSTSRALKECDDAAYREGFNNWLDSEVKGGELVDVEPELCLCGESIADGEGYDGECGNCADLTESLKNADDDDA